MSRKYSRRLGRDFWAKAVSRFEGSGQSQVAFCAKERLKLGTFRSWLYRLRAKGGDGGPSFVELTPRLMLGTTTGCIVRADGIEVEFAAAPTPNYLAELVAELGLKQ